MRASDEKFLRGTVGSLADYAAAQEKPRYCSVCNHPDREEIEAGLKAGIGPLTVARWLAERGEEQITNRMVAYHKKAHLG